VDTGYWPFGLSNATAAYQRLMETILVGLLWGACLVFVDDVIVIGSTIQEHCTNLNAILQRFISHGVKLSPKKCNIAATKLKILGHSQPKWSTTRP